MVLAVLLSGDGLPRCPRDDESIEGLSAEIEALARTRGLKFLDLGPALAEETGELRAEFTNDGIQSLPAGYDVWRNAIRGDRAPRME